MEVTETESVDMVTGGYIGSKTKVDRRDVRRECHWQCSMYLRAYAR